MYIIENNDLLFQFNDLLSTYSKLSPVVNNGKLP